MGLLTVHVVDDDENPVAHKRVFCNFLGSEFGTLDTHMTEFTDDDGIAEFDDIPIGEVDVIVNGQTKSSVSVGDNDHEVVTISI